MNRKPCYPSPFSRSANGEEARRRRVGGVIAPRNGEGDRPRSGWWRGLALAALIALTACTRQPSRETTHTHPTIVSLNPCADAILAEVAAPGQLLALSHYSADPRASSMDPAKASQYPTTRGTLEEVLALRPDIVIDGTFVPPATQSAYQRLGLRLETLGIASTVEQSTAQIRALAKLAGNPAKGEALIARIETALRAATPAPGTQPLPALVWEPGGIVPGDQTLIAELLRRTGFTNFAAARGLGQADQLPLERVLADPPAVILSAGKDRALNHPALTHLKATTTAPLDPRLLYCAGPTIIPAAKRLAEVRRLLSSSPFLRSTNGEVARAAGRRGNSSPERGGGPNAGRWRGTYAQTQRPHP